MVLVLVAAVSAGIVTTVAGFGGGLLLVLALATVLDPTVALATAAVGLAPGNAHRLWLMRAALDRRISMMLASGIVPATLLFAAIASMVPSVVLRWVLVLTAGAAVLTKLFRVRLELPRSRLLIAGAGIGAFGVTGGAGLFAGPVLLAGGLHGDRYVATLAAVGVIVNSSRVIGFGGAGWIDAAILRQGAVAAVALIAGNLIGRAIATRLSDHVRSRIEVSIPVVGVLLATLGLL